MKLNIAHIVIVVAGVWIELAAPFMAKEASFLLAKSSKDITIFDIGKDHGCKLPTLDVANDDGILAGTYLESGLFMCNFEQSNFDLIYPLKHCKLFDLDTESWVPLKIQSSKIDKSLSNVTTERLVDAVFCTADQRNLFVMFVFEPKDPLKDNFGLLLEINIVETVYAFDLGQLVFHSVDRGESFLSAPNPEKNECLFMPTGSRHAAYCMVQAPHQSNKSESMVIVEPMNGFKLLKFIGDWSGEVYFTMKERDPKDSSSPRYGCGQFSKDYWMTLRIPITIPIFHSNFNYLRFDNTIGMFKTVYDDKVKLLLTDTMVHFVHNCHPLLYFDIVNLSFYQEDLIGAKIVEVLPQSFTNCIKCKVVLSIGNTLGTLSALCSWSLVLISLFSLPVMD